ncbi:MAG: SoxR reducing system RseC family protein [Ignavibacteriales bacterium]
MREKGRVVRLENGLAVVRMTRSAACNCCGMCDGLVPGANELFIKATNAAGAVPGDTVDVEVETRGALQAAFLIYGLPLLGGAAGFVLGSLTAGGVYGIVGALLGFSVTFPIIHLLDRRLSGDTRFRPEIVGIEEPGGMPDP